MFPDEFAVFSCDDMNKIKVGPLAVSTNYQIERFFFYRRYTQLPQS